ncbi:MerR family transcriptional regulator [Streptomyces sp. NPDC059866]|uniref:MerR family transcriptional regulator n=1 Tax=Streptomyces sp. NPDC059866 TaxID=3346978 RepID=UPI0036560B32
MAHSGQNGTSGRARSAAFRREDPGLTTGAVARRLGVSPTTLRSWDRRYGIGPARRADGRHRRWSARDVAMLEAMCRLTAAGMPPGEAARVAKGEAARVVAKGEAAAVPHDTAATAPAPSGGLARPGPEPSGVPGPGGPEPVGLALPGDPGPAGGPGPAGTLPGGDVLQACRGLSRAAVRLDAPAVEKLLAQVVEGHGLAVAWQDVMVPALHAVGRNWESSGDRYVEVEHLLSWHVSTVLRRCTPPPAPPGGGMAPGPVVLACVPGEEHTLPLEALNAGLGRLGLPTRMLGGAVPAEAVTAAVRRLGPAAVVLWAQARSMASVPLARHVAGMRWGVKGARRQPLVVLGGPGWAGHSASGMLRPTGLREAMEMLSGVRGAPVAPGDAAR